MPDGPDRRHIDGATDDEMTAWRNAADYTDCDLVPSVLRGVSEVDLSVTVMS